jgi:hypothetical protein
MFLLRARSTPSPPRPNERRDRPPRRETRGRSCWTSRARFATRIETRRPRKSGASRRSTRSSRTR